MAIVDLTLDTGDDLIGKRLTALWLMTNESVLLLRSVVGWPCRRTNTVTGTDRKTVYYCPV